MNNIERDKKKMVLQTQKNEWEEKLEEKRENAQALRLKLEDVRREIERVGLTYK